MPSEVALEDYIEKNYVPKSEVIKDSEIHDSLSSRISGVDVVNGISGAVIPGSTVFLLTVENMNDGSFGRVSFTGNAFLYTMAGAVDYLKYWILDYYDVIDKISQYLQ